MKHRVIRDGGEDKRLAVLRRCCEPFALAPPVELVLSVERLGQGRRVLWRALVRLSYSALGSVPAVKSASIDGAEFSLAVELAEPGIAFSAASCQTRECAELVRLLNYVAVADGPAFEAARAGASACAALEVSAGELLAEIACLFVS